MDRRKVRDVLHLALSRAKQETESLIDAYGADESNKTVKELKKDIAAFEKLQTKLFGTTEDALEAKIRKSKPVYVLDLLKMLDTDL